MRRFKGGIVDEMVRGKGRPAFHTPGHSPKARGDINLDDRLAERMLPKYMGEMIVADRKRIGRRHARRKVARASRKRNR